MHIDPSLEKLLGVLSVDKKGKFSRKQFVLTQRFTEYLFQLQYRYKALLYSDQKLFIEPRHLKQPLQEVQLSFMNDLTAFFEQLYATLATLALLIIGTTTKNYAPKNITSSNEKLFNFLESFCDASELPKIHKLRKANSFRNKVVHYLKDVQQDWITYSYPRRTDPESVVIYFIAKGSEVYYRIPLDPYNSKYKPPVNYESFYMNPSYKETYQSLYEVVFSTLRKIVADKNSRPLATDAVDIAIVDADFSTMKKRPHISHVLLERLPLKLTIKMLLVKKVFILKKIYKGVINRFFRTK